MINQDQSNQHTALIKLPVFGVTFVVADDFWRPGDFFDISCSLAFLNMLANAPFCADGLVFLEALFISSTAKPYKNL